jgi:hypothetical protein
MTLRRLANESDEFFSFWSLWQPVARNTDGRHLAKAAFMKHVREGYEPQDIVDGAAWFIRNLKDREREFVPLSATWINRGTYLDLCEKERLFQSTLSQPKESTVVPIRAVLPANHFLNQYKQDSAS